MYAPLLDIIYPYYSLTKHIYEKAEFPARPGRPIHEKDSCHCAGPTVPHRTQSATHAADQQAPESIDSLSSEFHN